MKTIFRLMVLFFFVAGLTSCNDDDEVVIEPTLEVNFANIAGTWYLSEWNGTKLDDSRYWMGEWSSFYIITELRSDSMIWTVKEDAGDISVYTRCAEVPADIIAGTRVIQ